MPSPEAGWGELAITFDVQNNSWRQDFVPPIDHPDDPPRVDLADQGERDVREAGYSTQWMDKAGVGEKVCIKSIFLVCRRTLSEEMNDMRDLTLWMSESANLNCSLYRFSMAINN